MIIHRLQETQCKTEILIVVVLFFIVLQKTCRIKHHTCLRVCLDIPPCPSDLWELQQDLGIPVLLCQTERIFRLI